MDDHQTSSIPALIRSVLDDARELIREEIAVARAEIREEMSTARAAATGFGAAGVAGMVALVLFCIALGGAIAHLFGWPAWGGHGLVALLLAAGAYGGLRYGQGQLAKVRALPKTTATLQENMAWIQDKSAHTNTSRDSSAPHNSSSR
jgi:Putative Actinobacterial Holin-X, holin superfamily III